jgi:hypothetical protein
VLFDEIEKASDALWNLLLGILDKATLTLGDNCRVDFSCAGRYCRCFDEKLDSPGIGPPTNQGVRRPCLKVV